MATITISKETCDNMVIIISELLKRDQERVKLLKKERERKPYTPLDDIETLNLLELRVLNNFVNAVERVEKSSNDVQSSNIIQSSNGIQSSNIIQPQKKSNKILKSCYYDLECKNEKCPFFHPSGQSPKKSNKLKIPKPCRHGTTCINPECWFEHPSKTKI